jgi:hypothetical protein|tara:strand:- start:51 stop:356 length:306 start_codon:yes stop_codon:yes gene_type:complete
MKFDNRLRSTNSVVLECLKCVKHLEDAMEHDSERGTDDEGLTRSRLGEMAAYQWILYRITGEWDSRALGTIKENKHPDDTPSDLDIDPTEDEEEFRRIHEK